EHLPRVGKPRIASVDQGKHGAQRALGKPLDALALPPDAGAVGFRVSAQGDREPRRDRTEPLAPPLSRYPHRMARAPGQGREPLALTPDAQPQRAEREPARGPLLPGALDLP